MSVQPRAVPHVLLWLVWCLHVSWTQCSLPAPRPSFQAYFCLSHTHTHSPNVTRNSIAARALPIVSSVNLNQKKKRKRPHILVCFSTDWVSCGISAVEDEGSAFSKPLCRACKLLGHFPAIAVRSFIPLLHLRCDSPGFPVALGASSNCSCFYLGGDPWGPCPCPRLPVAPGPLSSWASPCPHGRLLLPGSPAFLSWFTSLSQWSTFTRNFLRKKAVRLHLLEIGISEERF